MTLSISSHCVKMTKMSGILLIFITLGVLGHNGAEGLFYLNLPSSARFGASASSSSSSNAESTDIALNGYISGSRDIAAIFESNANEVQQAVTVWSLQIGTQFEANVTEQINRAWDDSLANVDNGQRLNASISECLENHYAEFDSLLNDTLADLGDCIQSRVDRGLALVADCLDNKANALQLAADVPRGIQNCLALANGNPFALLSPRVIVCKGRLAVAIGARFTKLGAAKARIVLDKIAYLATLKIDLLACGVRAARAASEGAAVLAADVALCFVE